MKSMRMGKNWSWGLFSEGMTHGFVLEFKSQDDLDHYLTQDPMHKAFSQAAKDLIEDSVDIVDGFLFGLTPSLLLIATRALATAAP